MSERADDDVRGEQRRVARQLKQQQQQIQRGEGSTAMATGAERRSMPSPEIMLGQPWSSWVDAAKLHGSDGAESEESLKEFGKNREAMRLCRDDMPIFGQCPAQDDFYLVMCSHCSQVVKPQAFQAHYERRHSSSSKPTSTLAPSSAFSLTALSRSRSSGPVGGGVSGGAMGRSSSGTSTSSISKILKPAKEKLPGIQQRPHFPPFRVLNDKVLTPAVKVEKMRLKVDSSAKLVQVPSAHLSSSSSSSTVSSSSPLKPGLNCPSIPKAPLLAPGQIPNGKGHLSLSALEKKQDNNTSSRQHLYKRLSEREFNPDIHCGVLDMTARKPCTRSLTCKTHSLSQRRAVLGRRKRFDTLLAEHKSKARERELQHPHPLQTTPLREPHPSPSRLAPHHDAHQVAHGNGATDATKPLAFGKPKPHNLGLPRLNSIISDGGGGTPGDPHHATSAPDGGSRLSSDEGENDEREEGTDKLDCHYSGYHPRPAAFCTFGSQLFGRSCYSFDRRWDRMRCALTAMMDKHVNTQMWKKIPFALENSSSSSSSAPAHRTTTNSLSSSHGSAPASGFLSLSSAPLPPPYTQSYDSKSVLSYGTTLNARASSQGAADHPAYSAAQARQVSSSPQMPSAHSSVPSLSSGRPLKSRSSGKSFRPRESSSTAAITNSTSGGSSGGSSSSSLSSGKKRKNSSLPTSSHATTYSSESSSSSNTTSSSFKKNCTVHSGSSGSTYHHASLVSSSSSHSGVHSVGLNCGPNARTNSLSLKAEPSGPAGLSGPGVRGPPSGSPAESIKRMSVVMNSSDSTLSLGPFVHQAPEHHSSFSHAHNDGRLEGKKRKGSPAVSSINSGGGGGLGGGGGGPGRPKVAKSPAINNIHSKHGRTIPGATGLTNNSLIHQPKARP
ncbi:ataxin-7-like isoform X1 [Oncorhynchus keta]|uniref:ataxin-7-like isoform X1 n=2 Tax=Oncorhynchus keta TaxID=8018 RepID=UPI0015F878FB|nr:ataxin-7-like isoform X1 [Oncorhynchus keta]XP_035652618.1 ataxin-7-like isoform X1 [Oncorhynchus keta]XP_035652619.1 ataxin-7-like isoform X1 [Oncorhynchus keta]XP_035652620.1 ataxin-7-like isoform X1 [Oncorhynchus keta]XP_035652621.1 ataxin-7-like isoform X1 [Oncorhynchus keta]XP_035652622.1 ataxin-7-like isoform X1 [Oncorhynchus keta]XP_052329326.1 ataxin-7-like isoform X1 [Oncorhynchus keta]